MEGEKNFFLILGKITCYLSMKYQNYFINVIHSISLILTSLKYSCRKSITNNRFDGKTMNAKLGDQMLKLINTGLDNLTH